MLGCSTLTFTPSSLAATWVFCHGLLGCRGSLSRLARSLRPQTVCLVDAPGHGESRTVIGNPAVVAPLLTEVTQEPAVICGHSYGGLLGMVAALLRPERLSGLIVLDLPPAMRVRDGGTATVLRAMRDMRLESRGHAEQCLRAVVRSTEMRGDENMVTRFLMANLGTDKYGKLYWKADVQSFATRFDELLSWPFRELEGKEYNGPTVFIFGKESPFYKAADEKRIKKYFPQSVIETVASDHFLHVKATEACCEAILRGFNF